MAERLTRAQAIRAKCLDCCCGHSNEVRLCPCSDCPLYRYRLGHETAEGGIIPPKRAKREKHEPTTEI